MKETDQNNYILKSSESESILKFHHRAFVVRATVYYTFTIPIGSISILFFLYYIYIMDNGLIINNSIFIPREILVHILSFVHPYTLVHSCKLACRSWDEIIGNDLWKSIVILPSDLISGEQRLVKYPYPFGRNLLRNNCGQADGLEYWVVNQPSERLNEHRGWWIEDVPHGADPLPTGCKDFDGCSSCFTSSFAQCEKEQEIDLHQNGISGYLMDVWQPKIIVSEWFAGRSDCGCWYRLKVLLLDENKDTLRQHSIKRKVKQWKGKKWQKVTIVFENYGPGVRFIVFNHAGQDTQFWAGQYGSKMSGGVVRFSLSKPTRNRQSKCSILPPVCQS